MLIAARFLQGVGGAMASSVSLAMIVMLFPEPEDRAKAFGAFSFVGASGASVGQVLGGILTQALSWHWIFFVNLPIGLLAILMAVRVLDADRGLGFGDGADFLGAILVTSGLMLGIYAIVEAGQFGWTSLDGAAPGVGSIGLLAAFLVRQARTAKPLLPLRILVSRPVAGANTVQALMVAALFGFQVLIAMYLQNVLRYTPAQTGLAMLPAAVTIGAISLFVAARAIARLGEQAVLMAGLALLILGIGMLTRLPSGDANYATDLLPTMLSAGGFGLAITALTALGMSGARPDDAGLVSGLFNATGTIGSALGVGVLTILANSRAESLLASGADPTVALTGGFHLAFGVGTGLLLVALVISAIVLRSAPFPSPGARLAVASLKPRRYAGPITGRRCGPTETAVRR